jgi:uncharacterized membrane protein (DUF485 family)
MIGFIKVVRLLVVAWIAYALVLIFAPSWLHSPPNQTSGIIQAACAFALGYIMDRFLGMALRRRAAVENDSNGN